MSYVLDASALTAYFEKEPGYEKVQEYLTKAASSKQSLLLSAVNWGEVFYVTFQNHGSESAEEISRVIESFPIDVVPIDRTLAKQAALYKVTHKMSYADCFAAALTKVRGATLITGDRDFRKLQGRIKIEWL